MNVDETSYSLPRCAGPSRNQGVREVIKFGEAPRNRLYVAGLHDSVTSDELETLCSQYGMLYDVSILQGMRNGGCASSFFRYGLVTFYSKFHALRAYKQLNGFPLRGQQLRVKWGKAAKERNETKPNEREGDTLSAVGNAVNDSQNGSQKQYALSSLKAIKVLNHFVGFQNWSCEICSIETHRSQDPNVAVRQVSVKVIIAGVSVIGTCDVDMALTSYLPATAPKSNKGNQCFKSWKRKSNTMSSGFRHKEFQKCEQDKLSLRMDLPAVDQKTSLKAAVAGARLDAVQKLQLHLCNGKLSHVQLIHEQGLGLEDYTNLINQPPF